MQLLIQQSVIGGPWQLYRRLQRDANALRRITERTASRQVFRSLSLLGRVVLKTEEQVEPSELVWTDTREEKVNLAPPSCNRELPEIIRCRIGPYALKNSFVALNRRVRLIPPGPVPFDEHNNLLAYALRPKHYLNPFVHVPLASLFRSQICSMPLNGPKLGRACLLTNAWNRTYHHWVADLLPQIVILEEAGVASRDGKVKFIIPKSPARWQLESLELLGVPTTSLVRIDAQTFVEELLMPSFARREIVGGGWSVVSPGILRKLRERMYEGCGVEAHPKTRPHSKVYISRRMALGRQVINERELEQSLTRLGFRIAVTETMSYAEEVRLFSEAEIIVGAGGSGLSNVIFCRDKVKVVEIAANEPGSKYPDSTDYSLSAGLGHGFSVYLAKPIPRLAPNRFDLAVDVPDFCRFLQKVMETSV